MSRKLSQATMYVKDAVSTCNDFNLQKLISEIIDQVENKNRFISYKGKVITLQDTIISHHLGTIQLHFTSYTPDEKATAVSRSEDQNEFSEVKPPPNSEFLDGQMFLLIEKNIVILLTRGINEAAFIEFCSQMAQKIDGNSTAALFTLSLRADIDEVKKINEIGVEAIETSAQIKDIYTDNLEKQNSLIRNLKEYIPAILGIKSKESLYDDNTRALLRFSNTKLKASKSSKKNLIELATGLIEEENSETNYSIILQDNTRIRADKITLSEKKKFSIINNRLDHQEVWGELSGYYKVLKNPSLVA